MQNKNLSIPLIILVFLITTISVSQNTFKKIKSRNKIEKTTHIIKTKNGVSKTLDSTVIKVDSTKLDFIKDFEYLTNDSLVYDYINAVFAGKNKKRAISQFNKPVKIYLDPKLPKNITEEFTVFVNDIPKIKNLSLSFVNNIDDSNYYIELAENIFFGDTKEVLGKLSKERRTQLVFEKIKSIKFKDTNNNIYASILTLSPSIIDDYNVLTKIKKAFYLSLGDFRTLKYGANKGSVIDIETIEIDRLIPNDILILKMHYFHIYDFLVDYKLFSKIEYLKTKSK